MKIFEIRNLTFKYPKQNKKAVDDVSLDIYEGDFVVFCGASGSGKTTLLRQLKPTLAPNGERDGEIVFFGKSLEVISERECAEKIGYVLQDVENQIVTDKVWHELAFGLENLGYESSEIRRRVAEMASFFGIESWFRKSVNELSGGQKQLLNLASVMVMRPRVIILDEPSAQLDPITADGFFNMLSKINRELGTTIILSEHRLEEVMPICSRVVVMDKGKVICNDTPSASGKKLKEMQNEMFADMPSAMRIYAEADGKGEYPITVNEGRAWLGEFVTEHEVREVPLKKTTDERKPAAQLKDIWFRYGKEEDDVIRGASLDIYHGELLAIVGGNGSGKTTLLSLLGGLNTPYRGKITIDGVPIAKISGLHDNVLGILPQNPKNLFVRKTVYDDLREMSRDEEHIASVAAICTLTELLDSNPYDLSGGEQQRAALAKVLLKNPQILILDEPTKGMDGGFKRVMAEIFNDLKENGVTIVMVSHDIEFCAKYADRCAMLFDGEITSTGEPHSFFAANSIYTTAARRMCAELVQDAVTAEDIIYALTGNAAERKAENKKCALYRPKEKKSPGWYEYLFGKKNTEVTYKKTKLTERTRLASLMILALIPLTIFIGINYFGDRKYYLISLLILLEAMLPFAMIYESRKPSAREIVIIAIMCAIGVAGRIAFFAVPNFKPLATVIILTGAAFGGEAGFLTGAMSAFVSNFYFGQGPWTPWQMLAFGAIGFVGGVLFKKGLVSRGRLPLALYGGLSIMLVYGPIVDFSSLVLSQQAITLESVITTVMLGLKFNVVHAISTVIFMWIISTPMLDEFDRLKLKYGIYN